MDAPLDLLTKMDRPLVVGLAAVAALLLGGWLVGCDQNRIGKLQAGVSTEADVRAQFGEPAAVYPEAGGSRTLEYPRQPEGTTNYMITISAAGTMTALRQVLTPESFARITPGMSAEAVRRALGRPARVQRYALKHQEDWDWHWLDGQEHRLFTVSFDADARVVGTQTSADPRYAHRE